jgi:hypothetical protein
MKRKNWMWIVSAPLLAILAACASAGGAPRAGAASTMPTTSRDANTLRGEWAILAAETQLSDGQKAKLVERLKVHEAALATWERTGAAKLEEARIAKDANAVAALTQMREELTGGRDANILAILTAEQRARWEGFKLYRAELSALHRASPTDEQKKQLRTLCDEAGAGYAALRDESQRKPAREQIHQRAMSLLTAPQREALQKAASSKPAVSPGGT